MTTTENNGSDPRSPDPARPSGPLALALGSLDPKGGVGVGVKAGGGVRVVAGVIIVVVDVVKKCN